MKQPKSRHHFVTLQYIKNQEQIFPAAMFLTEELCAEISISWRQVMSGQRELKARKEFVLKHTSFTHIKTVEPG